MKQKFTNIATIRTGHVFRNKMEYMPNGDVNLLNMDVISAIGAVYIANDDVKRVIAKDVKPEEIINVGDILFKAKGLNNTAAIVAEVPNNTTVTSSCHIIRVIDKNILPEYLCLYLNSSIAKKHFSKGSGPATGVTISNVSKATIESLEIIVPPIKQQKLLVEIENCSKQEVELQLKITEKKKLRNNAIIEKELQKY